MAANKWKAPTKAEFEALKREADHARALTAELGVTREHRNALMNDIASLTVQVRALQQGAAQ